MVHNGKIQSLDGAEWLSVFGDTVLKEIPQPVPFMDAVKTFSENKYQGKKCRLVCEYEGDRNVYGGTIFTTLPNNEPVTFDEIVYGTWRVEE
jgi:hypothetical protein